MPTTTDKPNLHYRDGNVVLYLRGNYYQARMKLPDGRWHRISTKTKDIDEAAQLACESYDNIKFRDKNNMSLVTKRFSSVALETIKELQKELDSGYGKKTYSHYIGAIKNHLIPYFGNMNIDNIDYHKLMEFDQWRTEKFGHTPRKSTINNHNAALNRVFSVALKNKWIHPLRIPELKNTGTKTERRASFTKDEYRQLYIFMRTWCGTGRKETTRQIRRLLRDYVLILANTGMRHGTESTNLKWNNIEELSSKEGKFLNFWVKGKTGPRELVANSRVVDYLKRIQSRFDDLKDLPFSELFKVDEYVFRLENGNRPKDWHGAFEILLKDAGLLDDKHGSRRTLYSLRHKYASDKLLKGVSIHLLAKQMGTSVQMIEQHYSHLIPRHSAHKLISMGKLK